MPVNLVAALNRADHITAQHVVCVKCVLSVGVPVGRQP